MLPTHGKLTPYFPSRITIDLSHHYTKTLPSRITIDLSHHYTKTLPAPYDWEVIQHNRFGYQSDIVELSSKMRHNIICFWQHMILKAPKMSHPKKDLTISVLHAEPRILLTNSSLYTGIGSGSERRSAVEAIGRFINQSPGCRQDTILAPGGGVATLARQRGRFGLGTFWNEDANSGSREARDQRRDRQRCSG